MATRTINIKQLRKLLKQTRVSQPFVTRRDNRKFDRNSQQFIIHFHDHNIIVNLYDSLTTVFYDFMARKGECKKLYRQTIEYMMIHTYGVGYLRNSFDRYVSHILRIRFVLNLCRCYDT